MVIHTVRRRPGPRAAAVLSLAVLHALSPAEFARGENTGTNGAARKVVTAPSESLQPAVKSGLPALHSTVTTVAPRIDGKLDDVCWQNVPVTDEFTQVDPVEGAVPTERTELRVVHDRDFLYIAVECFDREPDRIVAAQMQMDAPVSTDDTVSVVFDTFGLQRDGYLFIVTPRGAKYDSLVATGGPKTEWDAIWDASGRINERGWAAEFAIPFKSISFGPAGQPWGFNVERVIRRKREAVRWASPFRNKSVESLADAGRLEGLTEIRKGIGIDFQPFLAGRYHDLHGSSGRFELEPGFDAFFRLSPSITASLTVNTDFAETEVDERRINLTRFPLFFPEKRDFFLQDASIFSFGAGNSPLPFHSRRIGLSASGETIDIRAGGKITGRAGPYSFGLLDVAVADGPGVPSKNLSAARVSRSFGESDAGAIFTYGDPGTPGDNFLAGADFNYRNSHLPGNRVFTAHGWVMQSQTDGVSEREAAFGGAVVYPNEPLHFDAYASQIDADFNPALGFVKRRGIREYGGSIKYRWRPGGYFRTIDLSAIPYLVTNLDNTVETEYWTLPSLTFTNQPGDTLTFSLVQEREQLFDPFIIHPGVTIVPGDYRFTRAGALFKSSTGRPLSVSAAVSFGDFYDGTRSETGGGFEWRASPHVLLGAAWEFNRVELPAGDFDASVASARINIAFNPRLSWNNTIQYDNISETVGINSRLRWIVKPGSDIFFVVNRGFDVEDGRFQSLSTDVTLKAGWTFRF